MVSSIPLSLKKPLRWPKSDTEMSKSPGVPLATRIISAASLAQAALSPSSANAATAVICGVFIFLSSLLAATHQAVDDGISRHGDGKNDDQHGIDIGKAREIVAGDDHEAEAAVGIF